MTLPRNRKVEDEIQKQISQLDEPNLRKRDRVSLQEEMLRAKILLTEAEEKIQSLMDGVKLGKQIDMQQVENLVDKMTESVLNNSDGDEIVGSEAPGRWPLSPEQSLSF